MAEKFSQGDAQSRATAIRTAYAGGVIAIYGGTQPATANDTEGTAPLLALITLNSATHTAGSATNGLTFDAPVAGVLSKAAAETWSGNGTAAAGTGATATWFRHYDKNHTTGASTTAIRFDGAISTASTSELQMSNTTIVEGVPVEIRTYTRTARMN